MLSEWVEPQWARRRGVRRIQVVAVLAAVLAALGVLGMFNQFGASDGDRVQVERRLVATVDLRIANPAEAFANGEAAAREDVEAGGELRLHTSAPAKPLGKADAARAQQLKRRYGIVWVHDGDKPTPKAAAFAAGYNHVVQAEIEKRHGADFLERLLRGEEPGGAP